MAERFVMGFIVSTQKLKDLVGSNLSSKIILKGAKDLEEELNEQFENDSYEVTVTVSEAIEEILQGKLTKKNRYAYVRCCELILKSVGQKLGELEVVETYYLPKGGFGCWNPVLKKIGLPMLSKIWASDNLYFPWFKKGISSQWPAITEFPPKVLEEIVKELESPWKAKLLKLDHNLVVDDEDNFQDTIEELVRGLKTLEKWIKKTLNPQVSKKVGIAAEGNSLFLIMDGDQ